MDSASDGGDVAIDPEMTRGYIDRERQESSLLDVDEEEGRDIEKCVDVVLSDMCEPWEQTAGFSVRTLSDPYLRMMNTSGNSFRDHVGSMVSLVLDQGYLRFCAEAQLIRASGSMSFRIAFQL